MRVERCEYNNSRSHIHMLVEIPPKMTISGFMGFLKSSIMIYQKWGNMKYKYRNRSLGVEAIM